MEVILINKDFKIENDNSYAVCLGMFDGIHLGHRALINKTVSLAKEKKLKSAVLTFIKKGSHNKLYTLEVKKEIIEKTGIDTLFIIDFDDSFKNTSAQDFIKDYIIGYLCAKEVICGFNFRFGKERCGSIETLKQYSKGFYNLTVIDKVEYRGDPVSTTLIKEYIKKGDVKTANELLGDYYTLEGTVKTGAQLGRTINFPTVNVPYENECLPLKCGVYAVKIEIDKKIYNGISNVGYAPTVRTTNEILTETHILDFSGEVYNKNVRVRFVDFIREEKKFDSMEILKSVISDNIKTAVKILGASEC